MFRSALKLSRPRGTWLRWALRCCIRLRTGLQARACSGPNIVANPGASDDSVLRAWMAAFGVTMAVRRFAGRMKHDATLAKKVKPPPSQVACQNVTPFPRHTFLRHVAAREPDATHVVLWDGAGYHPGDGDPGLPANVRLVALPPYSPELNPVEKLWGQLKDRLCNRVFAILASLEAVMTEFLRGFWQDARRVVTLIGNRWLRAQSKRFLRRHSTAQSC